MPLPQPALDALYQAFNTRLLIDEPLARQTTARIGGPADAFIATQTVRELSAAARIAWAHDVPLFILGGGSNILISDQGVRGLVVDNRAAHIDISGTKITADSGASSIHIARQAAKAGLTGFEWAIGVPGTFGGAIYGNAGAHGGDIETTLIVAEVITPTGSTVYRNADLEFAYRSSILKREHRPDVILGGVLQLAHGDLVEIAHRMGEYNEYRKRTQPPGATIGSTFKNPPGDFAGRLIEAAGLKGYRIGGAEISSVHANFFLNVGDATAADVRGLIEHARVEVLRQFGVELVPEIEMVGEW
jgi:UDP-N-acetylmuramate dehydrogenase